MVEVVGGYPPFDDVLILFSSFVYATLGARES